MTAKGRYLAFRAVIVFEALMLTAVPALLVLLVSGCGKAAPPAGGGKPGVASASVRFEQYVSPRRVDLRVVDVEGRKVLVAVGSDGGAAVAELSPDKATH